MLTQYMHELTCVCVKQFPVFNFVIPLHCHSIVILSSLSTKVSPFFEQRSIELHNETFAIRRHHIFPLPLPELSLDGEKLVDVEVKRALYGVKDIQEVMRNNELKHQHLMKSLKRSSEKKEVGDREIQAGGVLMAWKHQTRWP